MHAESMHVFVQAWLFSTSEEWATRAAAHDVMVVRQFDTNQYGTPMVGYMFRFVAEPQLSVLPGLFDMANLIFIAR